MATKFTVFPNLPPEIRLQIWAHAQIPRILKIYIDPDPRVPERPWDAMANYQAWASRKTRVFTFRNFAPLPATVTVNRESRECALKSYAVACDDSGPRFYFDGLRDTLWVEQQEYADDWAMLIQRVQSSCSRTPLKSLAIHDEGLHFTLDASNRVMLVKAGIQELFLIADRAVAGLLKVWTLPSRLEDCKKVDGVSTKEQHWLFLHDIIYRQFEKIVRGGLEGVVPSINVVERGYWEENGLDLKSTFVNQG